MGLIAQPKNFIVGQGKLVMTVTDLLRFDQAFMPAMLNNKLPADPS